MSKSRTEAKTYMFNGETHTLSELSKISGIGDNIIRARIKAGWSVEKAVSEKEIAKNVALKSYYIYKDKRLTIAEIAKISEMDEKLVRKRIHLGWDIEKIINTKPKIKKNYEQLKEGLTIDYICVASGMSKSTVISRLNQGWDIKSIMETSQTGPNKHLYKGELLTVKEISEKSGMSHKTIHTRIEKDFEKTETRRELYNGRLLTINELSKINNIPANQIWLRLDSGWSVEKAVETPLKRLEHMIVMVNN